MTAGLALGAPGVYLWPQPPADSGFTPVRLDVAGFVGVSLRGPVDEPVAVSSWSDFQRRFGGLTDPDGLPGPGRLPLAVQAFFAQGGRTAYIGRVAPAEPVGPDPGGTGPGGLAPGYTAPADLPGAVAATARFTLSTDSGSVGLAAADEGSWGARLTITLRYAVGTRFSPAGPCLADGALPLPASVQVPPGSVLRLSGAGLPVAGALVRVLGVQSRVVPGDRRITVALLDPAPPSGLLAREAAPITGTLLVRDGDPTFARAEQLSGLGLYPEHPRFPPWVLPGESQLLRVIGEWAYPIAPNSIPAADVAAVMRQPGADRFAGIDGRSFFDDDPADADPLDEQPYHRGADRMGRVEELGLLCVPDLAWSWTQPVGSSDPPAGRDRDGCFHPCRPAETPTSYPAAPPPPPMLDARDPDQLQTLVDRQLRLVDIADLRHRFVALLDVPLGLPVNDITSWRAQFDTSFAAAYHPWLETPGLVPGAIAVPVPPSAHAAGIVAAREVRLGLPWGPANELAALAVSASDPVPAAVADQLHLLGINVFRAERDGFRLSAAHTLSSDPAYRQLSIRRLMTMIGLTLQRQSNWLVFEPNTTGLRSKLFHCLTQYLSGLYRQGAFAGDTEQQSFFVRCDDTVNPAASVAMGRLIVEIGVAPAAPLEYLVLRIAQDTDGSVQVVTGDG